MKTNLRKLFFAGAISSLIGGSVLAQSVTPCHTSEAQAKLFAAHPELIQQQADYDAILEQQIQAKKGLKAVEQVYTIPVVFHVIYVTSAQNIPDATIAAQMNRLNLDWRKQNSDTTNILSGFNAIAADTKIQFALAKIDPNGNCTNGIDRIYSHKTYLGSDESKLNPWPRDKYLNIWVVDNIPSSGAGTTLGYAYFPGSAQYAPVSNWDGIIMIYNTCNGSSRTLTHEAGHWLNLQHPWGGGEINVACGDDGVTDTPETKGHFSTCPSIDSSCAPGVLQNINNYMDYSSCTYMFTNGQKDRIRAALESSISQRNNLWSAANLAATGVTPAGPACAPKADFTVNRSFICSGSTITYTRATTLGTPTTTSWDFGPNASPSTSNSAGPVTVTYNTSGVYETKLVVGNAQGTDSITKQYLINVDNANGSLQATGYYENFQQNNFWQNWRVNDLDENGKTWSPNFPGYNSSYSVKMEGYTNYYEDIDELISPSYDFTYLSGATLTFKYAGASRATSAAEANDVLKFYYSTNCGSTWTVYTAATMQAAAIANNGFVNGEFMPYYASNWATKTITLPATLNNKPNVRFKWEYATGLASNNFYIDDINLSGVVGINEQANSFNLGIYPNPTTESTSIAYHLTEKGNVKLEVVDVLGKKVAEVINSNQTEGDYNFTISKSEYSLKNGIYFVRLTVNNAVVTRKLVITE